MIMVKNLLRVHLLLCMDSYAECSTQLVLEVIRVSVHHQEYMAKKIILKIEIWILTQVRWTLLGVNRINMPVRKWKIMYKDGKSRRLDGTFILLTPGSLLTLSPANTLNDSITCSAVSLSVVSLVMNSINDLNVTCPVPVGSTIAKIRWNSASPLNKKN